MKAPNDTRDPGGATASRRDPDRWYHRGVFVSSARWLLALSLLATCFPLPAAAELPVCPAQQPPPAASPAPPSLAALFQRVRQAQSETGAVGAGAGIGTFCVTPHAVFFDPSWLPALDGPPQPAATARIAFALAARRHFLLRNQPHDLAVEQAATATGCTLARLGLSLDAITTVDLELRTALATLLDTSLLADGFGDALRRGGVTCGAR
ncbi:MAG: hypothetical protein H6704_27970 [Myxococcales bacterium]|nr:hypothetical protein [Myxococcales bacterium]